MERLRMIGLRLCLLLSIPALVYSAATHETRRKRSVDYGNQYSSSGYSSQPSYYGHGYNDDSNYWNRYENFLAGQALFGQDLGVKGPRVGYQDAHNSEFMGYLKNNGFYGAYDSLRSKGNGLWKQYGYALYGNKNGKSYRKKRSLRYGYSTPSSWYGAQPGYGSYAGYGSKYGYGSPAGYGSKYGSVYGSKSRYVPRYVGYEYPRRPAYGPPHHGEGYSSHRERYATPAGHGEGYTSSAGYGEEQDREYHASPEDYSSTAHQKYNYYIPTGAIYTGQHDPIPSAYIPSPKPSPSSSKSSDSKHKSKRSISYGGYGDHGDYSGYGGYYGLKDYSGHGGYYGNEVYGKRHYGNYPWTGGVFYNKNMNYEAWNIGNILQDKASHGYKNYGY